MSIDILLEAARYLEWIAQQQQTTREEEHRKEKLFKKEAEFRRDEVVTSSSQPVRANHITCSDDAHRQQPQYPPPPPQVPIAVLPMVPVVTATPSVSPLPLPAAIAAATPLNNGSTPVKTPSSPPPPQQQPPPPPASRHLLCALQLKVDTSQPLVSVKPQVHIQYPTSIGANGSQHVLVPQQQQQQQQPPSSLPRPKGATLDELRALEGKKRPGGAGTREGHNKLEQNRRAHLKECFETLKKNVPNVDEKKTSNLSVLRSALRYIQTLKRKEKEYEHEMERLAREKISTQQRLAELKNELSQRLDVTEIDRVLRQTITPDDDQGSTSTASEGEDNYEQDMDEDVPPLPLPLPLPPSSSFPKPTPPLSQAPPLLPPHLSIQHATLPLTGVLAAGPAPPQAIAPPPGPSPHAVKPPAAQPTVITHASVIHKHLTHIAPSPGPAPSNPQPIAAAPAPPPGAPQPIGHITVHPVARLPALYPQGVSVGHITHTFTHHLQANPQANANGAQRSQGNATAVLGPHPQLVGQATVLNPVTMVTVPTFPVSTLKLA